MLKKDTIEDLQNDWRDPYRQWYAAGMPTFECYNLEPWKQIKVKFRTKEARQNFGDKLGYSLTDKTNVIWYPEKSREKNSMNRYTEDE